MREVWPLLLWFLLIRLVGGVGYRLGRRLGGVGYLLIAIGLWPVTVWLIMTLSGSASDGTLGPALFPMVILIPLTILASITGLFGWARASRDADTQTRE
jgi:hypothetical protein